MVKFPSHSRRDFMKTGLLGFAGVIMLPSCLKNYTPFLTFSLDEASVLVAICECIIPEDEYGPGATGAGVIYYIDKQLHEVFTDDRAMYRQGLAAVQASSMKLYSNNFEDVDREKQVLLLEKMENNEIDGDEWEGLRPSDFFNRLIDHSMQGFYGPPRHGGNKNYISYKMMDLDYPYVVGQNRYREKPVYEN